MDSWGFGPYISCRFQYFNCFDENQKLKPTILKTGAAIALTAGGVLAYTLLTKRSALSTINFFPVANDVTIQFDGATPVMTIGLAAQNTSNQQLVLRSFAGDLLATVNGTEYTVGNISSFTQTVVAPNSQTVIELQVRLFLIGVVNDLIRSLQFGNFQQDLRIKAFANIDNYQIPVDLNYKIGS